MEGDTLIAGLACAREKCKTAFCVVHMRDGMTDTWSGDVLLFWIPNTTAWCHRCWAPNINPLLAVWSLLKSQTVDGVKLNSLLLRLKLCTCNLCKTTLVTRCRGTYVTTRVILGVNFQCSLASSKKRKSCHSFSPADFIINPEEVTNQCELPELSKTHRHPVMHIMSVHLRPLIVITPSHFISPWLTFLFLFSIAFFCLPQSSINGKCNKS